MATKVYLIPEVGFVQVPDSGTREYLIPEGGFFSEGGITVTTQTVTASIDALLQKGMTKTASLDALLLAVKTKSASIDALLKQAGIAALVNLDALLKPFTTSYLRLRFNGEDEATEWEEEARGLTPTAIDDCELDTSQKTEGASSLKLKSEEALLQYELTSNIADCDFTMNVMLGAGASEDDFIDISLFGGSYGRVGIGLTVSGGNCRAYLSVVEPEEEEDYYLASGNLSLGTWYQCRVTVWNDTLNFYVDGVLKQTHVFATSPSDTSLLFRLYGTLSTCDAWVDDVHLKIYSQEISASIDALIQYVGKTGSAELDALLQKSGLTASADLDAYLLAVKTSAAALDALLQAAGRTGIASIDALLLQAKAVTVDFDALLLKGKTATAALDAILTALGSSVTRVLNLDALLQASGLTEATSIDALLQAVIQKATALDAVIQRGLTTATVSMDAIIRASTEAWFVMDALLQAVQSLAISLDALIAAQRTSGTAIDAKLIYYSDLWPRLVIDAVLRDEGWAIEPWDVLPDPERVRALPEKERTRALLTEERVRVLSEPVRTKTLDDRERIRVIH